MKILVVVPSYDPATGGGVASCLGSLCQGLAQSGVDVTVFTTNASGTSIPLYCPTGCIVNQAGVKVRYFPSTFGPKSSFDSRALSRELKREVNQYDLVYVSAVWQWIGVDTARICHNSGVPMVVGLHGSFARRLRTKGLWKKVLFRQLGGRQGLRRAAAIHVTTESERIEAIDWLEGLPSFVVPNAVDPSAFHSIPEARERFRSQCGIPVDATIMLTVGRPDWMKRVDLLIEAITTRQEWYLLVVGPDNVGMTLEWKSLAANLGVEDRIIWAGYLTGNNLLTAYSAADLFALISHNENFGMVVVEALLCGLPVIVSAEVGVWEILADADVGTAVPLNANAISNVLGDFIANPERWKRKANKARAVAKFRLSPNRVATLMKTAFEDILSGQRSQKCHWHDLLHRS